jgi:cytochrome c553
VDYYAECLTCGAVCKLSIDGFGEEEWWPVTPKEAGEVEPSEYADSTVSKCAACHDAEGD